MVSRLRGGLRAAAAAATRRHRSAASCKEEVQEFPVAREAWAVVWAEPEEELICVESGSDTSDSQNELVDVSPVAPRLPAAPTGRPGPRPRPHKTSQRPTRAIPRAARAQGLQEISVDIARARLQELSSVNVAPSSKAKRRCVSARRCPVIQEE